VEAAAVPEVAVPEVAAPVAAEQGLPPAAAPEPRAQPARRAQPAVPAAVVHRRLQRPE